jgi:hypothetical protein
VERHRRALSTLAGPRTELAGYDAMVGLARRLSLEVDPVGDSVTVEPVAAGAAPAPDPVGADLASERVA